MCRDNGWWNFGNRIQMIRSYENKNSERRTGEGRNDYDVERKMSMTKKLKLLLEFVMLTLGAVIAAFAIEEFLVPNTILDGGVIGIGIMINNLTEVSLSILTIVLNVPFLIIGSRQLGKMFMVKSGYSMAVFSVFVEIFKPLENATSETILAVCFGGVILGLGVGIIIKFGGCLDGTETVAIMLNKKKTGRLEELFWA